MRDITHGTVKVGKEPTLICVSPQGNSSMMIQNASDVPIFIGGPDVASDGERLGFRVKAGENTSVSAFDSDTTELYAVAATETENSTATVVFMLT